jgi:hypothetical protein
MLTLVSSSALTGGTSLGLKRPGREADHSCPSNVDVENEWSCISTPPHSVIFVHMEALFGVRIIAMLIKVIWVN